MNLLLYKLPKKIYINLVFYYFIYFIIIKSLFELYLRKIVFLHIYVYKMLLLDYIKNISNDYNNVIIGT